MTEIIDEKISVNLINREPTGFFWRGRSYNLTKVGLHHTFREGRVLLHIFSVTDGNTFFKLQLNTETLQWKLVEIEGEQ